MHTHARQHNVTARMVYAFSAIVDVVVVCVCFCCRSVCVAFCCVALCLGWRSVSSVRAGSVTLVACNTDSASRIITRVRDGSEDADESHSEEEER